MQSLSPQHLEVLRHLDPTPRRRNRFGQWRDVCRTPYMPWLSSLVLHTAAENQCSHQSAINKLCPTFVNPRITALLWLHARLAALGLRDNSTENALDLSLTHTNAETGETRPISMEELYDKIVRFIILARRDAPVQLHKINTAYPDAYDIELFGLTRIPTAEDELRRSDVIKQLEKREFGRFAHLFEASGDAKSPQLEVIFHKPGQLMLLRHNGQAGVQEIAGNGITPWCTALNGADGEGHYATYQADGPQYTLLAPASGGMVAVQFSTGRHEDHNNISVPSDRLGQILREQGVPQSVYEEMLVSVLESIPTRLKSVSPSWQGSTAIYAHNEVRGLMGELARHSTYSRPLVKRARTAMAAIAAKIPLPMAGYLDWHMVGNVLLQWRGGCVLAAYKGVLDGLANIRSSRGKKKPATLEDIRNAFDSTHMSSLLSASGAAYGAAQAAWSKGPESVADRFIRRYILPHLVQLDDMNTSDAIVTELGATMRMSSPESINLVSNRDTLVKTLAQTAGSRHVAVQLSTACLVSWLLRTTQTENSTRWHWVECNELGLQLFDACLPALQKSKFMDTREAAKSLVDAAEACKRRNSGLRAAPSQSAVQNRPTAG